MLADADRLGQDAMEELAANRAQAGSQVSTPLTAAELEELAQNCGYDASPGDAVRFPARTELQKGPHVPPWRLGVTAAKALREQIGCAADQPISNSELAEMAGTSLAALDDFKETPSQLSFVLDSTPSEARVVLRSKWLTGRRFDLARLICDRLIQRRGALHPATRAYTYRQKAQRAFAAELLSPFEAVDVMLANDYDDEETRRNVADHFKVSEKTIETLLMYNGRLERNDPEQDFDVPTRGLSIAA